MHKKVLSISSTKTTHSANLLNLSPEILEKILMFCDLKSLLRARLAHPCFYGIADHSSAKQLNLDLKTCVSSGLSPLQFTHFQPTQYFANMTTPLTLNKYALNWIHAYNLDVKFIQSCMHLYPDGKTPIPYGIRVSGDRLVSILKDGRVIIWKESDGGVGYEFKVLSLTQQVTMLNECIGEFLYALKVKDTPVLLVRPQSLDLESLHKLVDRKIMAFYDNDVYIVVKLDDGQIVYLRKLRKAIPKLEQLPPNRKAESVCILRTKVFASLLDNGDVLSWGMNVPTPYVSILPKDSNIPDKVQFIVSGNWSLVAVMDDLRTIIQYGQFSEYSKNTQELAVFQLREREDIVNIYPLNYGFVALLKNKKIKIWGMVTEPPELPKDYAVKEICQTDYMMALLFEDGTVFNIPTSMYGYGGGRLELPNNRKARYLFSTNISFVALLDDHTIYPWGNVNIEHKTIPNNLKNKTVKTIFSNNSGFIALLEDHRVCYWGSKCWKGKMINIPEDRCVKFVFPCNNAFVIQLDNDHLLRVGYPEKSPPYENELNPVFLPIPQDTSLAIIDKEIDHS